MTYSAGGSRSIPRKNFANLSSGRVFSRFSNDKFMFRLDLNDHASFVNTSIKCAVCPALIFYGKFYGSLAHVCPQSSFINVSCEIASFIKCEGF